MILTAQSITKNSAFITKRENSSTKIKLQTNGENEMKIQLSDITCGHSCWYAKEVDCKCSCGGRNHGVLLNENGIQPQRTKKANGYLYHLQSVGNRIQMIEQINQIFPALTGKPNANAGWFDLNPAKAGNPFLIQYATQTQAKKWAELSEYKDVSDDDWYFESPSLLWRRDDVSESYFD